GPIRVEYVGGDPAAGVAVIREESLRLVAVEARLHVVVVVHGVVAGLVPNRRRRQHLLAAFEREQRVAFRHVGLALPIVVLARDDAFWPGWRIGGRLRPLGVAI